MKLAIAIVTSLACVSLACVSSASADCDLSTDAGIAAAYKKATGKTMSKDNGCVHKSSTFSGLVWVGSFVNDFGCRPEGVLVGCALSPSGFAAKAMARAGWAKADLATRKKLALAWLKEIDDLSIVESKPDKFPKPFTAPTATAKGKATVIELWLVAPPGMQPIAYYSRARFTFAEDGTHGDSEAVENLEVPLQ